jgi:hypothetical protein
MGGGSQATISVPNTAAYDRMFEMQKAAIDRAMSSQTNALQDQLTATLRANEKTAQEASDMKRRLAEDTSAQAMRMAALIGTPPPEKSAQAPVVGRNRGLTTTKGKGALRIERTTASSSGQGSGLNIT